MTSSNLIAVTALVFTLASFWVLNARRGRLRSIRPGAYAFGGSGDALRLRFPLVLFNSGAVARLVGDLRLVIEGEDGKPTLRWVTTRSKLRPGSDDGFAFPTPFAVLGRNSRELIAEFEPGRLLDRASELTVSPIGSDSRHSPRSGRDTWIDITTFDWWAPPDVKRDGYFAHRNERV